MSCVICLSLHKNNLMIELIMKKRILFTAILAVFAVVAAVAQPRAIGGNIGYGIGFSYQHNLSDANMIDLAVNIPFFDGIGGICTYDWVDPFGTAIPWNEKGEWHWNLGVGGAAGIYGFGPAVWYAGVAGHIGVAYDFWFPLELSVDWRPNIGVCGHKGYVDFNGAGFYDGISIGVRYLF